MKKIVSFALSAMVATTALASLASCGGGKDYTVGMICLHGTESTYDKNFIDAMKTACANKGLSNKLKIVTGIEETQDCYDAAIDLVDQGCEVIFADSFGHEAFMKQAAQENPDVEFCHATGTMAADAGLSNFHNAFADIYQGRYLAGYAAGLKLIEMHTASVLVANNYVDTAKTIVKTGYVGAWPYAEVKSGYTSYYLGMKAAIEAAPASVTLEGVQMEVQFTNSWYHEADERSAAQNLISRGAALISQHADSMGAPSACEAAGVPNVSYNGSTADKCPNTFIVSSRINWVPYFEYMIDCVLNDQPIVADYCKGFGTGTTYNDTTGSVVLTDLGTAAAAGTAEVLNTVMAGLKSGEIKVFDCANFTVKGVALTSYTNSFGFPGECIVTEGGKTFFAESSRRSAPYFDIDIDGIVLLATGN